MRHNNCLSSLQGRENQYSRVNVLHEDCYQHIITAATHEPISSPLQAHIPTSTVAHLYSCTSQICFWCELNLLLISICEPAILGELLEHFLSDCKPSAIFSCSN